MTASEDLLKIPLAERTEKQWDQLHDVWAEHTTWCKCQICLDVEKYLNWRQMGGKFHE